MKFVTVRDFRSAPAQIWKQLSTENEMIITNNGKPIALLTPISDSDFEETIKLLRKLRAVQAVKQMQEISLKNQNSEMTADEIQNEIDMARK